MPANGDPASLEIENRFDLAPVRVESQNVGAGASYANVPTVVTVDDCTFNGLVHPYANPIGFGVHGGSVLLHELVVGADCRFVQTTGNGGPPTYDVNNGEPVTELTEGVRATVNATGPTWVTVFDNFLLGAMQVGKAVTGAAAYAANAPTRSRCTAPFNDLPLAVLGPDGTGTLAFEPDGTLVPNHASAALGSLPVRRGLRRDRDRGRWRGRHLCGPDGAATVPGSIAITNTFEATSLRVAKHVEGNDSARSSRRPLLVRRALHVQRPDAQAHPWRGRPHVRTHGLGDPDPSAAAGRSFLHDDRSG